MTESRTAHDLLADVRTALNQTPGYTASVAEGSWRNFDGLQMNRWQDGFGQDWSATQTHTGIYECSTITVAQPTIGLRETVTIGAHFDTGSNNTIILFEQSSRGKTLQTTSGRDATPGAERVLRRLQAGATPRR